MNKITLTGNIVRNIELNRTSSGKEYINNCIAVRDDFKSTDGTYHSQFFDFVVFGATALYMQKYCQKGTKVLIEGRLTREDYEAKDGTKKSTYKVVVNTIESFRTDTTQSKTPSQTASNNEKEYNDEIREEDLPF
jgi:single-strand DNA-binding protein